MSGFRTLKMSQKKSYQPEIDQDSTSAPNLALVERYPSSQPALKSVHLDNLSHIREHSRYSPTGSRVHNAPFEGAPTASGGASSSAFVNEDNDSEIEDDTSAGGPTRMTRAERKRIWRKNLSAEKIARLRERDAFRKRVERQNMTPEKRRDLRTKDTARKAALRRERRMSGGLGNPPGQGHQGQPGTRRHERGSDSTTTTTTNTNTNTTIGNAKNNNHTNQHSERSQADNEVRRHSRHLHSTVGGSVGVGGRSGDSGGVAGGGGGGGSRDSQRFFKINQKRHEKKGKIPIESLLN